MKLKITLSKMNEDILQTILKYNVKSLERVNLNKYIVEFEVLKKDNAEKQILNILEIGKIEEIHEDNKFERGDFYS